MAQAETGGRHPWGKHLLALSIATAGLRALSACGDSGDGEPEGEDQGAEEKTEESETPEVGDSEGASAGEDGNADDATAAEDADGTDEVDAEEVPDWSEVTSLASAAMEEAESVSMQISAPYAGAIMPTNPDETGDVEVGDPMVQEITGEIFGNATYVETLEGTDTTFHFQGPDTILISLEDELAAAEEQGTSVPFTADDVDGDYIDYSQELGGQFSFGNFIGETFEFQLSDWDSAEAPEDIDPGEIASQADLEDAAQP